MNRLLVLLGVLSSAACSRAPAQGVALEPDGSAGSDDAAPVLPDAPRDQAASNDTAVTADLAVAPDGGATTADPSPADTSAPADAGGVWAPKPGSTWQWQLTGTIDTSFDVQMYDVDLFGTAQPIIDGLHAKGRTVICYLSAGSREDWRPDAAMFPAEAVGKGLDGWPGEKWLDTRSEAVRAIMRARLDRAVAKKCDGVEPDNVDAYTTDTGFPLTAATQLDYNRFLAREAHARGLSVGLKNDLDQVPALLPDFDWALDEQCLEYDECDLLKPFIEAGKAVFHVEYGAAAKAQTVCPKTKPLGFSTLIKKLDLDAWRVACP